MTAIEALRRHEASTPRLGEPTTRSSRFGTNLADAVARRDDVDPAEPPPDGPDAAPSDPNTAETDAGRADASRAGGVTNAPAAVVVPAGDTGPAVAVETPPALSVVEAPSAGPRINNGGMCSCCTPGAFRPAAADAMAGEAAGDLAVAGTLPPPTSPRELAPPAGPAAPMTAPDRVLPPPVPGVAPQPSIEQLALTTDTTAPEARAEPDDREAAGPVLELSGMAGVAATPTPSADASPTPAPATTVAVSSVSAANAGVAQGAITAAAATMTVAAGAADSGDADDSDTAGREQAEPVTGTTPTFQPGTDAAGAIAGGSDAAAPSRLGGPSVSEGVLRSEQVRVMRELAPNREVQRLAFELDGARVAVRFDQDGTRVNVVADPANRLGAGWADDVQRTLDAGARQNSLFQQRDADGGRRNRQDRAHQDTVDERTAADFAARLGATERG